MYISVFHRLRLGQTLLLLICALGLSACQKSSARESSPPPAASEGSSDSAISQNGQTEGEMDASIEQKEVEKVGELAPDGSMRRVAYFTSWSAYARGLEVGDMDPTLFTHVNFAFANLDQNGEICVGDSWVDTEKPFTGDTWEDSAKVKGHFGQLRRMKEANPDLQILISVGGWSWSGNFSATAATEEGRRTFAASAANFLSQYGFDGLDIDWEFPVEGGDGIEHRPEDRENYTLLLREVRDALDHLGAQNGKHYLLTIAGGPNVSFTANTQLKEMMDCVDFINVMTYDYHGSWDSVTGHNAPLYAGDGLSVSDTIRAYIAAGALPEKLNLGLPFYGRGWTGAIDAADGPGHAASTPAGTGYGLGTWESSVFDYWDLKENYVGKNGYIRYFDPVARVPYLYNGSVFISYDDPESVGEKLAYAAQNQLGGVMFWEFGGDREKELQRLICEFSQSGIVPRNSSLGEDGGSEAERGQSSAGETAPDDPGFVPSTPSPAWNSEAVYENGDTVSYGGAVYQAKWWTQNQEPAANCQEWGPWKPLPNAQ